jgi:segregation and condensation protein B
MVSQDTEAKRRKRASARKADHTPLEASADAVPAAAADEEATAATAAEFLDRFAAAAEEDPAPDDEALRAAHPLRAIVEALVFASPEPISLKQLVKLVEPEGKEAVRAALDELAAEYERSPGLQLVEVAGGYEIVTRPELHEWVRRLFKERTTAQKLSRAALETLAVVAYKQPITAAEIAEVRGVNTAGVLGTLLDRKLIKIAGRKQVVGRPFMYATTREFLDRFGLADLADLPKVEDMSELLGFDLVVGADAGDAASGTLPFEEERDQGSGVRDQEGVRDQGAGGSRDQE